MPILNIGGWHPKVFFATMPETAIKKYRKSRIPMNKIGPSIQICRIRFQVQILSGQKRFSEFLFEPWTG